VSEIQKRSDAAPVPSARKRPNPLKQLPKEWRPVVSFFWMANSHLLKDPLALVTRLRFWMDEREGIGLTLEELKPILARLLQPAALARFEFHGQLLAALAEAVAEIPAERRKKAKANEPKSQPPSPGEMQSIREIIDQRQARLKEGVA